VYSRCSKFEDYPAKMLAVFFCFIRFIIYLARARAFRRLDLFVYQAQNELPSLTRSFRSRLTTLIALRISPPFFSWGQRSKTAVCFCCAQSYSTICYTKSSLVMIKLYCRLVTSSVRC